MPVLSRIIDEQLPQPLRLDRYVSEKIKILSRSQIKTRNLKALINGNDAKLSKIVKNGDSIELTWDEIPAVDIIPEDIPLAVIFENEDCIVVNKAQGMVVHPGAGNRHGTLVNALYFRRLQMNALHETEFPADRREISLRSGIVHRLDKDTSGVIIASYNDSAHSFLSQQFKSRVTRKNYIAVVQGIPRESKGRIETFIARDPKNRKRFTVSSNGKTALTFYKVIRSWMNYSFVLLSPKTGRTHQLRVHMRHIGHPVMGDTVYGNIDKLFPEATLMLHSKSLAITLPGETEKRVFSSEIPERFSNVMQKLNRMNVNGQPIYS